MKTTVAYPRLNIVTSATSAVGQAGGVLLTETVRATGLDRALSTGLARWRKPTAFHDPGKVIVDLAVALALGGDALADVAVLRAEPGVYGAVASDPTVSRTIAALAADAPAALAAINTARAAARSAAWRLAGERAPDAGASAVDPLVIDLDATLVTAHSEKENAAPTFKRGFGFHPLCAFVDHGGAGTGEPLAIMLRPGNAGSNTAADHIAVLRDALAQLPGHGGRTRGSKKILVRTDGAGGTKTLIEWLTTHRLGYSVGFTLPGNTPDLLARIPETVWAPALDAHDEVRDGAWIAELTDLMDLTAWPAGMRVIVRKERPHPGAQLRFEDVDGMRITAFVTNTPAGQLADLELRHRRRARCEDRIRIAKDTGLRNLPLKAFAQNQIWCAIVALANDLLAWMGMLALTDHQARRWEPKRLRLRLFTIPAVIARTGRRTWLRLSNRAPWAALAAQAVQALRARPAPG
ncbi:IS1380 family transposase [Sanguibacter antarcticus]|uniref:DDE family transposase n=1 Tax=Sanguibacter antarcticus TaxID=372484 RepID=A0A2A9E6I8_9MICO|nr:IS1380 family transposase [Sanguibacter antarcticus]PFG32386.1 DDE family transposase [Sanguibacter antarcticus]PFG32422.1 DDE family transposase [Sanguibacter antarcticus]PFG33031.1 DDE family transposase [Sanguibacter antarcticus]PFG33773.1 DDE family transposase [Sanguibacter antarcticus]PFG34171.1 DDE family transposase [Sanguibacter antarcticus]